MSEAEKLRAALLAGYITWFEFFERLRNLRDEEW